jgi:UDP-N-acetylglucosamine--N-acetylmuramyl-(pentapeptide) pyrophosphoryl-undecaprenol N-acetylglucosamine transferase
MTNARALEAVGAAILIPQASLTVDRLDATIGSLVDKPERMAALAAAGAARARPNAAAEIAQRIARLIHQGG